MIPLFAVHFSGQAEKGGQGDESRLPELHKPVLPNSWSRKAALDQDRVMAEKEGQGLGFIVGVKC